MPQKEIRIKAPQSFTFNLQEIWEYRELLYFFVWRDIKVKYKQTYLGILWVILQPALLMILFYFIFSKAFKIAVNINYPVFAFSGLILWGLFSSGISNSSESLISNAAMIRKIYFPRLLIPFASLLGALVDFFFSFLLLFILLLIFKQSIQWNALFLFPLALAITFISSFSIGTLLSAMNVKYRDFRYMLPFLIQLLFFCSQIVYSSSSISNSRIKLLFFINPLNGALEIFRKPFHNEALYTEGIFVSIISLFVLLFAGLFYFRKTEAYFADLV